MTSKNSKAQEPATEAVKKAPERLHPEDVIKNLHKEVGKTVIRKDGGSGHLLPSTDSLE